MSASKYQQEREMRKYMNEEVERRISEHEAEESK